MPVRGGSFYGGMRSIINSPDEKPRITRQLLKRVLYYAKPYRWLIGGMLLLVLVNAGLMLLTPLILRDLIDNTIPNRNIHRLIPVSYTHLRAHETRHDLVCRLLLE